MNTTSTPPGCPVDLRDPRIRVTFPDVAMRIAHDGPMYGVIALVGVLALKGVAAPSESLMGAALALLARSSPPSGPDKAVKLVQAAAVGCLLLMASAVVACSP